MHARHCSPQLGRFLSVDPAVGSRLSPQSWNRFAYVTNNPLNFTDPFGLLPCGSWECDGVIDVVADLPSPSEYLTPFQAGIEYELFKREFQARKNGDYRDPNLAIIRAVADQTRFIADIAETATSLVVPTSTAELGTEPVFAIIPGPVDNILGRAAKGGRAARKGVRSAKQTKLSIKRSEEDLRRNKEFRRWFHREFKPSQRHSRGPRRNPELSGEQVLEAYDEWRKLGGQ